MNELSLQSYDYDLPHAQIATEPLERREDARLLVYYPRTKNIEHHTFDAFESLVPRSHALVINDTKVLKARFFAQKDNGKSVEFLYHHHLDTTHFLTQIRGRVREGQRFWLGDNLCLVVAKKLDNGLRNLVCLDDSAPLEKPAFLEWLQAHGQMPIPPYLGRRAHEGEERDYQNPFAQHLGAIAAPTASLHFSPQALERLKQRYRIAPITLHIGAGTFQPVSAENILEHAMHSEEFCVPKESAQLLESDTPLLAIGTTAMRTIEEYARSRRRSGACTLFLHPQNRPKRVHALLTNFHLPKSSLLMLVASMIGLSETHRIYGEAIVRGYRFYSYGDAMLIADWDAQ